MLKNPEIQARAQMEIDEVVGRNRLPTIEDLDNLPYVKALISEVLRWHPVGPIGLPHRATKDVHYGDYVIPKDSIIIANLWYAFLYLQHFQLKKSVLLTHFCE